MPNELLNAANVILERVVKLSDGVEQSYAFRALLENLHSRDLSNVKEPHVSAMTMVRAGILRSAIGSALVLLDKQDRHGNRASIGQILHDLEDADMVRILVGPRARELDALRKSYSMFVGSDLFARATQLRNDVVGHWLDRATAAPTVRYEDIYELQEQAMAYARSLHSVCGRNPPTFAETNERSKQSATIFWDTYFSGIAVAERGTNAPSCAMTSDVAPANGDV